MLVSEIIERTYNEWLYPSGVDRPSYDVLSGTIDSSTLTIILEGRAGNVPDDSVVEIDNEQILVKEFATTTKTITAKERGWLETGAAAHTNGAIVWIDPTYTRKSIFNALVSIMGLFYPYGLYARLVDTATVFSYVTPTKTLPAGGKKILKIAVRYIGTPEQWNQLVPGRDFIELLEFAPPKYMLRHGGAEGATMQVVYKSDFTLPTAETDDLSSLASPVPPTLQPYLPMAVAGYLLQGREVPRVVIDDIKRRLAAEGVQVGAALNVGTALLDRFVSRYLVAERDRLVEADSVGIEFSRR